MTRGHGELVIVIDDEDQVGSVAEKMLLWLGYRVRRSLAADLFYREFKSLPFAVDVLLRWAFGAAHFESASVGPQILVGKLLPAVW